MRGGRCLPGPASLAAVGICVDRCIQAPGQPCPGALGRPLTDNEFFGGGGLSQPQGTLANLASGQAGLESLGGREGQLKG